MWDVFYKHPLNVALGFLYVGSGEGDSPTSQPVKIDSKSAALCLDLLLFVTLRNRDRIVSTWQLVESHLQHIILPSEKHGPVPQELLENAVLNLLKVCQRLLPYKPDVSDLLLRSLELVLNVEPTIVRHMAQRVALEVLQLVKGAAEFIHQVGKTFITKWNIDWLGSGEKVSYVGNVGFGWQDWELGCKSSTNGMLKFTILIIYGSVFIVLFPIRTLVRILYSHLKQLKSAAVLRIFSRAVDKAVGISLKSRNAHKCASH